MREQKRPTHVLDISVPLNLEANPAAESWDIEGALAEALKVILPLVRVGTLGLLCDDPIVTFEASASVSSGSEGER
jgi:hypothetical protein